MESGSSFDISPDGATEIVCPNDWRAMGVWVFVEDFRLRVLVNMSATGTDNQMPVIRRGLTTVVFSYAEVDGLAVEDLLGRISGKSADKCCYEVAPRVHERKSVLRLERVS